jgi:hypothetical protein
VIVIVEAVGTNSVHSLITPSFTPLLIKDISDL